MKKAEKEKILNDSNWGSRKGRSAQDAAIIKTIHYDITHLTLGEYAAMENDAKSCYDRMVPSLTMLISRSFGIRKEVCKTVGRTFERTRHHIATANGISRRSFGYSPDKPIFGSWQGATKSVINWVLMSSLIQQIHSDKVKGAEFESTDGKTRVTQTTVGFVDDNNNCVTGEKRHITQLLQESAQKWEKLLFSSGGMLELNKCFTYIIKWDQDNEGRHKMCEKKKTSRQSRAKRTPREKLKANHQERVTKHSDASKIQ
jgi:hypothetical protein